MFMVLFVRHSPLHLHDDSTHRDIVRLPLLVSCIENPMPMESECSITVNADDIRQ